MEKQNQTCVRPLYDLRPPDKVNQNSGKNALLQKKDFKKSNVEFPSEKFKNNHSQKPNFKVRRADVRMKQASNKNNQLPSKSNATNKAVKLKQLYHLISENDSGLLLQLSSANKIDTYKCCKCGRPFKSVKSASMHYSNCKFTKFMNSEVLISDVRWVCLICHALFLETQKLSDHLKKCNLLKQNYEKACEKRCEKCHFRCISDFWIDNHDCEKELKNMKTCAVRLNAVKVNSSLSRVIMRECEFCGEIFDEQFTELHFQSHHPGEPSCGNFKQYYVNLNPGRSSETVVVKTEPNDEFEGNFNGHSSSNPIPDNISMPPPSVNLHTFQSSGRLPLSQSSYQNISDINKKICKCGHRNTGADIKPCLKCLSRLDVSKFLQNLKVIPFGLAKIKRETSEDSGTSNPNTQADSSSTHNGEKETGNNSGDLEFANFNSMTPPSSHNGISPPSTPEATMNIDPSSVSDVSIESLNDDMVPDIAQLDEPRCPDDLVRYINNDNSPEMTIPCEDDQGLFADIESYKIRHLWDVDNLDTVDVWAVVPSEGNETIEKYICSECIAFSCSDQNSILKHLCENHEKKPQFLAMYIIKSEGDSL